MPVFQYKHDWCGMEQQVFLKNETKNTVTMPCYRCGRTVMARQIRDKSVKIGEADGTVGVLRRNEKKRKSRGRGES